MLKKIIASIMIIGIVAVSASVLACECKSPDQKYEYYFSGDRMHEVWSVCQVPCGAPYSRVGLQPCEPIFIDFPEYGDRLEVCELCDQTLGMYPID